MNDNCAFGYMGDNCQQVNMDIILQLFFGIVVVIAIIVGLVIAFGREKLKEYFDCKTPNSANNISMERL